MDRMGLIKIMIIGLINYHLVEIILQIIQIAINISSAGWVTFNINIMGKNMICIIQSVAEKTI